MAMTKPYRIDRNGSQFTVTNNFGIEFAVYNTEEEARKGIQRCEQDDTMLQTASLVNSSEARIVAQKAFW
jgi:hypothetical protein